MRKSVLFLLTIMVSSMAFAAGGGHGEGVPPYFKWQLFNFTLFVLLLFFLFRKRLPAFFAKKREDFLAYERKARQEKEEALRAKRDVERDLQNLLAGRKDGLENAKREANAFAEKMKQEAAALDRRLKEELARTESIEMEKVAYSVRTQLIERSVERARESIKRDLVEADDKRLQNEFVEKIQVVN
jgi:F-type H+-transporting ATPase subunit b